MKSLSMYGCVTALLLGAAAGPASAGSVYVPLAINSDVAGIRVQSLISVSNSGGAAGNVETFFIPSNTDGTNRPAGNRPVAVAIPARTTVPLGGAANNTVGLLEVSGNPGFQVAARLVGPGRGSELPVVSSKNVVAAGGAAHLQGLVRDGLRITSYGLVNLGRAEAQCSVQAFRATGQAIGSAATVNLPALSLRQFADPLAPDTNLSSVRATATCNQPFYAFYVTVDLQTGDVVVAGPGEGTDSTLTKPGEGPGNGTCGSGIDCFERAGTVFKPTRSAPTGRVVLPFSKTVAYTKARLQVDVTHGGWNSSQPDGIHQLFTLARGDSETRLGYAAARGPGRNFVFFLHNLGLPGEAGNRFQQNVPLQPGQTYHVDYTYDPANERAELVITRGGTEVVRLSDTTTFVDRIRAEGDDYFVEFGLAPTGPHAPTYNWTYANLKVEFFR